jgi:transposase-like protein
MSRARKKKAEKDGNSLGALSSVALAGAERSEGERSEPQRSAAAANAVPPSRRDPEVVAKAKRRTFTAEYKLRILQEAESAAATRGGLGALLRREGLYSSLLATWRRERANGILEALTPQKRGPKSRRNPLQEENLKLQRQNARLTEELRKAHIIIDVPKKCMVRRRSARRIFETSRKVCSNVFGLLLEQAPGQDEYSRVPVLISGTV